ncbi:coiled-coil domain-containing protein 65 homolog [Selaginella moellendorffii]|uniref:coiled-coil domain-containing protein 65 homolog n=1 Tax=Selaginella moellendorffii TaxID=88036 RepID=UPI000D1C5D49|nr:coiled-coil domain-containing protein 65 homolog [Selaginella moellendorffii]|eukprot:XP_024524603.1 coiled-coil domain-containing protein 65 homolog [Selaginella moellendorffii]
MAKGKKMTPEEKKLKAQMMTLKAEEARKKKEAEQRARLVQLQEREERYTKDNTREIHAKWREILRQDKTKELREEVMQCSEEHDFQVRRKDALISSLFKELEESEGQHLMLFSKHLHIVDGLIDLHYSRLKGMDEEFQNRLHELSTDFNNEKMDVVRAHDKQKKVLNDMMAAMEAEFKEAETEMRQEFEANREELKNKNMEEYNVLKISLENAIEELERRLEQTHQSYLSSTDTKTQAFKRMIEKDKVTAKLIEQRMRKLIHIHESISYWRAKIATNSREWEGINKALRDQKDSVNQHYQELKKKLLKMRNSEHIKLKEISKMSEEARLDLTGKLEVSERIIRLGDLNCKLETEHERIFPFDPLHCSRSIMPDLLPEDDDTADDVVDTKVKGQKRSVTITEKPRILCHGEKLEKQEEVYRPAAYATDKSGSEVEEWNYLSQFQQRYNKVLLDKMALDLEKKRVAAENFRLQSALTQYLDGITVNDNVLKGPMNTLLMVSSIGKVRA